jgi:hypothetical protein
VFRYRIPTEGIRVLGPPTANAPTAVRTPEHIVDHASPFRIGFDSGAQTVLRNLPFGSIEPFIHGLDLFNVLRGLLYRIALFGCNETIGEVEQVLHANHAGAVVAVIIVVVVIIVRDGSWV